MQGWPSVGELVLPAACADAACVGDVMDGMQDRTQGGLSPLHLAVRSGSAELVGTLTAWAQRGGYEWCLTTPGPRGLTPLHLAALLPDNAAIATLLLGEL